MALGYVLNGLAITAPAGAALLTAGRIGVLAAGVYVLSAYRSMVWIGLLIGLLVLALGSGSWGLSGQTRRVLEDAFSTAFLAWILVVVVREVFRPETSELDAVVGALCGFLLILLMFSRVHALIEAVSPGAYQVNGPPLREQPEPIAVATFQYFSTVTLTTVGFGDIVPLTPVARIATGAEAITGQLYLAVVIATLVGRVVARGP